MSVICTYVHSDYIKMLADSQITRYMTADIKKDSKIFQVNDLVVGSVGYARDAALLRVFCKTHRPADASIAAVLDFYTEFVEWVSSRTQPEKVASEFHIAFDGKAFFIQNYYVAEIDTYLASGTGADYVLGALHAGASPEKAMAAACDLNIYCNHPINVFEVKR